MPLTRISVQVDAADAERAVEAFTAAGIPNSVVEWQIDEPYEEAFGAPPPALEAAQVAAYIAADRAESTAAAVQQALQTAWNPVPPPQITREPVKDRDWRTAWHDHFDIVRIPAKRPIIIRPPHREYRPKLGEIVIDLAPGLAFGTGQHQSTRLALKLLSEAIPEGESPTVLDVGTGSGILAVAAAKLGASSVHAVDIDPLAVEAARETARRNGAADRVTVEEGSVPKGERYDLVLANLTADLLQHLAEDLAQATGGNLIVSGFTALRLDEVQGALKAYATMPIRIKTEDQWMAAFTINSDISHDCGTDDSARTPDQ